MKPVLLVHGGAGRIDPAKKPLREPGLRRALDAGWAILREGGSALDAVVAAVQVLEDDPLFNAGRGSTLTRAGTVEMDAGLMDGATLEVGAVAGIRRVANPIVLAREVLKHSPHMFLIGPAAEDFAQARGLPLVDPEILITEERRQALAHYLAKAMDDPGDALQDTVGAVALDAHGHLAAATSTGGMLGKWPGRVGDSPLVGCGFYAEDGLGAASSTGWGETIARSLLAYRAVSRLASLSPEDAAHQALDFLKSRTRGEAGLLLLAPDGRFAVAWNTPDMSYAWRTTEKEYVAG